MPDYQVPDGLADRRMYGTGDLAVFLGGSEDSFTGLLLVLICKAQSTPENFARLTLAFPREVTAWRVWNSMSPVPTFGELRAALEARAQVLAAVDGPDLAEAFMAGYLKRQGGQP